MELRHLRGFAEVVRAGTFRAAAANLHITQPALWQQVRSLQDELGVELFERAGRRVRLTTAGAQLLERATEALSAAGRVHELAGAIRAGREGIVRIATPYPPITHVLAKVIGGFARSYPEIQIEIRDSALLGHNPIDALLAGEVDLAVAPRRSECDGIRLYRVDVRVVVGRSHAWARRKTVHVHHLRDRPLLVSPPGSLSRGLLERACAASGFNPTIRMASPSPAMLVPLARCGLGIAIVASDALVGLEVGTPPVLVDDDQSLVTDAWLHWRRDAALSPAVRLFAERVRAEVR